MHGKVISTKPASLQKKRENRNAVALDTEQNPVQKLDVVKVIDGPHSGRQGQIKHLFRNFAFLHSRMMLDNGGIFVCKCRHLVLAGKQNQLPGRPIKNYSANIFKKIYIFLGTSKAAGGNRAGGAGGSGSMPGYMSPRLSSPMHPSQGGAGTSGGGQRGGGRGRGRGRGSIGRDRELIGQTIKITQVKKEDLPIE